MIRQSSDAIVMGNIKVYDMWVNCIDDHLHAKGSRVCARTQPMRIHAVSVRHAEGILYAVSILHTRDLV